MAFSLSQKKIHNAAKKYPNLLDIVAHFDVDMLNKQWEDLASSPTTSHAINLMSVLNTDNIPYLISNMSSQKATEYYYKRAKLDLVCFIVAFASTLIIYFSTAAK